MHREIFQALMIMDYENPTLKKCWVVLTQIWVKYGQTQMLG